MLKTSIFRFRQDLRIYDNIGLVAAVKQSNQILPIFILDENSIQGFGGFQDPRLAFLRDALIDLDKQLHTVGTQLYIFRGIPEKILPEIFQIFNTTDIHLNTSYDTHGMQRDFAIKDICKTKNIRYHNHNDILLNEIKDIKPYKVFSPYFKAWEKHLPTQYTLKKIEKIIPIQDHQHQTIIQHPNYVSLSKLQKNIPQKNIHRPINFWKDRLETFDFAHYEATKNFPAQDGVSKLSPYIRFGLVSIRQLYNTIQQKGAGNYCFELGWREFWHQIGMYFPYTRESAFIEKRQHLARENNEQLFKKFCDAETGYPIVDASIRQLKATNRMHNRLRMVVASFLTKDLLIDRKRGEEFFKKYLIDYEELVNIGNWQWSASVGADPKPIRIFSPIRQSQRFDPNAEFILERIPELKNHSRGEIHDPLIYNLDYHRPIVNHKEQVLKAKAMYYAE